VVVARTGRHVPLDVVKPPLPPPSNRHTTGRPAAVLPVRPVHGFQKRRLDLGRSHGVNHRFPGPMFDSGFIFEIRPIDD
jgi:hypothetical protein